MKKVLTKIKSKAAFTLAEVLIVIAILGILSSIGFISVSAYKRRLARIDMDNAAMEIFISAQNHLTTVSSQNYLGKKPADDGAPFGRQTSSEESIGVYYFVTGSNTSDYDSVDDSSRLLGMMLPWGSIEETTRVSGSFIIRYQKDPAQVLDVFYASGSTGDYGYVFDATDTEYQRLFGIGDGNDGYTGTENDSKRLNFPVSGSKNAVIGWYGGTEASNITHGAEILSPVISAENGEDLVITVNNPNPINNAALTLIVVGTAPDGTEVRKEIPLISLTKGSDGVKGSLAAGNTGKSAGVPVSGGPEVFTITLDSLGGPYFKDMFSGFVPGGDLTIYAVAENNYVYTNVAESNVVEINSMFGSKTDLDNKTADISNLRHLQNLDKDKLKPNTNPKNPEEQLIEKAKQNNDIKGPSDDFKPINLEKIEYDGGDHKIEELYNSPFEEVKKSKIENLILENIKFTKDGNAGALASTIIDTEIRGVKVGDTCYIEGTNYVGGLVGEMIGGNVYSSSASALVKCKDPSVENQAAGGFIGRVGNANDATDDIMIRDCYAGGHTQNGEYQIYRDYKPNGTGTEYHPAPVNVQSKVAGGFIGIADTKVGKNNKEIQLNIYYCYSTCSTGDLTAAKDPVDGDNKVCAGFVAKYSDKTHVRRSYCVGKVYPNGNYAYTFAGEGTSSKNSFSENWCLTGLADGTDWPLYADGTKTTTGYKFTDGTTVKQDGVIEGSVEGTDGTDDNKDKILVVAANRQPANTNDPILTSVYGGKYYYKTIEQLDTNSDNKRITKAGVTEVHNGDWQVPPYPSLALKVNNGDVLSVDITLDSRIKFNGDTATLSVSGAKNTLCLLFTFKSDKTVELTQAGYVSAGYSLDWTEIKDKKNVKSLFDGCYSLSSDKKTLTLVMDDITVKNRHFSQLFTKLVAGEDLILRCGIGSANWSEMYSIKNNGTDVNNKKVVVTNGLFADPIAVEATDGSGTITYTSNTSEVTDANTIFKEVVNGSIDRVGTSTIARIANARHLQNLELDVSYVSSTFTTALMIDDVTWWDSTSDGKSTTPLYTIYSRGGGHSVSDTFYGIYNEDLDVFDGNDHTIYNLYVNADKKGYAEMNGADSDGYKGDYSAGLFRYMDQSLKIKNVQFVNPLVNASVGSGSNALCAGVVLGEFKRTSVDRTLTLEKVLVRTDDPENYVVYGGDYAGGLVGYTSCLENLVIKQCAVNLPVWGNGNVGGFVGSVLTNGKTVKKISVSESYVSGFTVKSDKSSLYYDYDAAATKDFFQYNILGTKNVGGFFGYVDSNVKSIAVTSSFSTASVSLRFDRATSASTLGGLFGTLNSKAKLTTVYLAAPVALPDAYSTKTANVGPFIGSAASDTVTVSSGLYYLADVFETGSDLITSVKLKAYVTSSTSGKIKDAHFATTSNIAAIKDTTKLLQDYTYPVNTYLKGTSTNGVREYPFAVWTTFRFNNAEGDTAYYRTYYGDWQPLDAKPTVTHSITFKATNPVSNKSLTLDSALASGQFIYDAVENKITTPRMPEVPGYDFSGWQIEGDTSKTVYAPDSNQVITVSKDKCTKNLTFIAVFAKSTSNYYSVIFKNGDTVLSTQYAPVAEGKQISYREIKTPDVTVAEGKRFVGWYTSASGGTVVDFTSKTKINKNITVYAVFVDTFDVTINFEYQPSDDAAPVTLGIQAMKLQFVSGQSGKLVLPDQLKKLELKALYTKDADGKRVAVSSSNTQFKIGSSVISGTTNQYKYTLELTPSKATELFVVFKGTTTDLDMATYSIVAVLNDTAKEGSNYVYKKGSTVERVLSTAQGPVGSFTNVLVESGKATDLTAEGFALPKASQIHNITLKKGSDQKVTIDYYRETYSLSYNTLGGTYFQPATVPSGISLSSYKPTSDPIRQGYTFSNWVIHNKGAAVTTSTYSWSDKMPARNVEVAAVWTPGTVDYKVMFWYEKSDSDSIVDEKNYDFVGFINQSGTTGTVHTSDEFKNYLSTVVSNGSSVHTHNAACYQGVGSKVEYEWDSPFGFGIFKTDEYYLLNNVRITFDDSESNESEGKVISYKGEKDSSISGKLIYTDGDWYAYTGTTAVGKTAPTICDDSVNLEVDNINFEYNSYLVDSVTLAGDGTSILNVYYKRKVYSLTFYDGNSCLLEEHTHTETCYEHYLVNADGSMSVNEECFDCGEVEHTHSDACGTNNCDHTHDVNCYGSFKATSTVNDIASMIKDSTKAYVARYDDSSACSTSYKYYFYYGGKYYTFDSADQFNNMKTGDNESSKSKWILYKANAVGCTHVHDEDCYSCGKEEHTHSISCYKSGTVKVNYLRCTKLAHKHGSACSSLKYDGDSPVGYISAKYNAEIYDQFPITSGSRSFVGYWWNEYDDIVYDYNLASLDRMPGRTKANQSSDLKFYNTDDGTGAHIYYYEESLDSSADKTQNGIKFKLYKDVEILDSGSWYLTDLEDFHEIEGFNRYGYQEPGSSFRTGTISSYDLDSGFYYTRKQYTAYFIANGTLTASEKVKYGTTLGSLSNISKTFGTDPSTSEAKYTFMGWYKDPELTVPYDLASETMPAGNIILYGGWVAPIKNVYFCNTKEAAVAKSTSDLFATVPVQVGRNIESVDGVVKADGTFEDAYTYKASGKTFEGWFYVDNGVETAFISSRKIDGDVFLYPRINESTSVEDVKITFCYEDTSGKTISPSVTSDTTLYSVGKAYTFTAKDISGYYATTPTIVYYPSNSNNVVTFVYSQQQSWTYLAEYYVTLSNTESLAGIFANTELVTKAKSYTGRDFNTLTSNDITIKHAVVEKTSTDAYCDITGGSNVPDMYNLIRYEVGCYTNYNSATKSGTFEKEAGSTTVHQSVSSSIMPVVKYYVEPNVDAVVVSDSIVTYNGDKHRGSSTSLTGANSPYYFKTGTETAIDVFTYVAAHNADGNNYAEAKNAGTYSSDCYVVLRAKNSAGTYCYYLLKQYVDDEIHTIVKKRKITLTSANNSGTYNASNPQVLLKYDITVGGDESGTVKTNGGSFYFKLGKTTDSAEGIKINFTVDAFRLQPGKVANSFSYTFLKNTSASNYDIITSFGTLTIK